MKLFFEDCDFHCGLWKFWTGWQYFQVPDVQVSSVKQDEDTGIVEAVFKKGTNLKHYLCDSIEKKWENELEKEERL